MRTNIDRRRTTTSPPSPASPHELRNVLIVFSLLLLVVIGIVFAFARFRLFCLAVPCDVFLHVRGRVVDGAGDPIDGCTLTIREQPGADVLPGPDHLEPFESLTVGSTFEESLFLSPFADRYFVELVDCPGGAASAPLPLDLNEINPYLHDLGRVVVARPADPWPGTRLRCAGRCRGKDGLDGARLLEPARERFHDRISELPLTNLLCHLRDQEAFHLPQVPAIARRVMRPTNSTGSGTSPA